MVILELESAALDVGTAVLVVISLLELLLLTVVESALLLCVVLGVELRVLV